MPTRVKNFEFFYLSAMCLYVMHTVYDKSLFTLMTPYALLNNGLRLACAGLLLLSCATRFAPRNRREAIYIVALIACSIAAVLIGDYIKVILPIGLIALSGQSSFEKTIRVMAKCLAICYAFVVASCLAGILPDLTYSHDITNMVAHTVGFHYYSSPQSYIFTLSVIYLYLKKGDITYPRLIGLLIVTYTAYRIYTTRLYFYAALLLIALYILIWKFQIVSYRSRILKWFMLLSYPVFQVASILVAIFYDRRNPILYAINHMTSGRLNMMNIGYKTYGINLLAQNFVMVGSAEDLTSQTYFYIDNGYLYTLLAYGVLFTIILMVGYLCLSRYIYAAGTPLMIVWYIVILVCCLSNNFLLSPIVNPFVLLIGPAVANNWKKKTHSEVSIN